MSKNIEEYFMSPSSRLTNKERDSVRIWLDTVGRYECGSYRFCCLLGWYILDDINIPLSPKEAGFD